MSAARRRVRPSGQPTSHGRSATGISSDTAVARTYWPAARKAAQATPATSI